MASSPSSPFVPNGTPSSPENPTSSPIRRRSGRRSGAAARHRHPGTPISTPLRNTADYSTPRRSGRSSSAVPPTPSAETPISATDDVPVSSEAEDGEDGAQVFVWGTNISVQDVNAAINRFLRNFRDRPSHIDGKYMAMFRQILEMEGSGESLDIDASDVLAYDPDLYGKMVRYPLEVLAIFDIVLIDMVKNYSPLFEKHVQTRIYNLKSSVSMRNLNPSEWLDIDVHDVVAYDPDLYGKMVRYPLEVLAIFDIVLIDMVKNYSPLFEKHVQTRIYNLKSSVYMRNLNPSDIEKLVSVKGMIIRCSSIIPDIREAVFQCLICGYFSEPVLIDRGRISEPSRCPRQECQAVSSMTLIHNRCRFAAKQIVKLQETPDEIPEGGTPHTVSVLMHDKLVDSGKPGDRVEVTGVYRAMSVRIGPTQRTVKSLFKTYIDCIHLKKTDKSRLNLEDIMDSDSCSGNKEIDDQSAGYQDKVEKLKELSKQPDIYERLTKSLAPNIWELDDVKKGLLCQLFGGNALNLPSGANFRGDINILLVGDPGTSKSQLLTYMHKLSPRGIYTSGRGSSAVGLTAYVTKDPETGETVLESGALVLSDKGICCIDEFDKMSDNARSMLHEVMEQQTVSIAKAGIIASLNARTSVLACANPSGSRYNPRLSVIDNIHLPPTLLSRFDLIYLILDKADEQTDRRLAKHIVALHFENPEGAVHDVLDLPTLTAYISYAQKNIHPQLSDEAAEALTLGYVEMRRRGNFPGSGKKIITATPRQIESLLRLSEALARIRFSEKVEKVDVTEAFRLLEVAMQQSATDHATGTIDMDLITTGVSSSERMKREKILTATKNHIIEKMQIAGPPIRQSQLLDELRQNVLEMNANDLRHALQTLMTEGFVLLQGDNVKRA